MANNKSTKIGLFILVLIAVAVVTLLLNRPYIKSVFYNESYARTTEPVLGIYNVQNPGVSSAPLSITHCAVIWKNTALGFDDKALVSMLDTDKDVLITIESWIKNYLGRQDSRNVLYETLDGSYDRSITQLGKLAARSKGQIYIRWNPDMEVPAYVYPWQFQSPEMYIQAFNYVSKKLKQVAPRIKMVWGPSGYPGDTEYWPGKSQTDLISITLGSASEKTVADYKARSAQQMLQAKLHRMRFLDQPVLILGSEDSTAAKFDKALLTNQYVYTNTYKNTAYSPVNYVMGDAEKPNRMDFKIGVFDPYERLLKQPEITVEHLFTDWGELQRGEFETNFNKVIARHHDVIITMEPWKGTDPKPDTNALLSTLQGRYDKEIAKLYSIISNRSQTVYLRWAHEMEIPIHRYAWQSQDPVTYINTFRYFMQFPKVHAANIKRVWGPAGDRGSVDFWPGSDVVDYISIAIYGLPDKNITDPNKQEAFDNIFHRKYYRMRFLNRPLFITETGVKGPEAYQKMWLTGAAKTLVANKHVFGICYFNLYDNPEAWGNIKAPDWSISPANMKWFSGRLLADTAGRTKKK